MVVDERSAMTIAVGVFKAENNNPDNYDMSIADSDSEWVIAFVGKPPRQPGDEIYVYVRKSDGTTRSMYGE